MGCLPARKMEEGRKMLFVHMQLLSLSVRPSTSFALDGKRKHKNENGGDAGNLTIKKATRPPQLPCSLYLGGVADLPLTTLWQPAIMNMRTHSVLHVKARPALTQRGSRGAPFRKGTLSLCRRGDRGERG